MREQVSEVNQPDSDDAALRAEVEALRTEVARLRLQDTIRHHVGDIPFRRLSEAGVVGVIVTTFAGQVLEANDAFLAMLGFSRAELEAGQVRWFDLTPPDYRAADAQAIATLKQTGVQVSRRKEFWHKDGRRVPVLIGHALLDGAAGTSIAFVLDLTEQKKAEDALRESQARTERILQSITDAFFVLDSGWRFTYINARGEQMLRRERDDLLGTSIWDEFPESVGSTFDNEYRRAMRDGVSVTFEEFFVPLNAWFEVRAYPSSEGLSVYFRDITRRKESDAALRQSQHQLQAIIDNSSANISIKDTHGRYLLVSRRMEHTYHVSRDMYLGRTDHDLFPQDMADAWEANDRLVLETGQSIQEEETLPEDDGVHTYLSLKFPLLDAADMPYAVCAISTDITERKMVETGLRELNDLKDRFLSVASHELRTPLTSIKGYTQLLMRDLERQRARGEEPNDRHIGMLQRVVTQADHMALLVEQLLDASRIQEGRLSLSYTPDTNISALVRQVVDSYCLLNTDHPCQVEAPADILGSIDSHRIAQVLVNLVSNAFKFSPAGAPVVVGLEQGTEHGRPCVSVWVRDYGEGIAPEDAAHIFDQFYRIRSSDTRALPGLGLGLFISAETVARHGGRMWVESALGEGSTFFFTLPLTPA